MGKDPSEIQEWSEEISWRYVPTEHNPADIASQECDIQELKELIWLKGPSFLLNDSSSWPVNAHFELTKNQILLERGKTNVFFAVEDPHIFLLDPIEKYSSYKKLLRVTAFVVRFADILRKCKIEKNCPPTAIELKWAFFRLVEAIQKTNFSDKISKLQKSLVLPSNIIHTYIC